jgi:hypothetical protein
MSNASTTQKTMRACALEAYGGSERMRLRELPVPERRDVMSANLCVEAHMHELIEQSFEVAVVRDAMAVPWHPKLGDGYTSALVNFGFIANTVRSTDEVVKAME